MSTMHRLWQNLQLCVFLSGIFFTITASAVTIRPIIEINTEYGSIRAELYAAEAPITVRAFLRYIDDRYYRDIAFYRTVRMDNQPDNPVKISVIQGGYARVNEGQLIDLDTPFPDIPHESTDKTGLQHLDGTLSMARLEPGTANGHFAIMIGDQPELNFGGKRNPDGQGFAAFGRVIEGMDIVKKIHQLSAEKQKLTPPVRIISIERVKQKPHY